MLAPALLEWEGSAVVIDIKGQLASITGPERARMGQRVVMLNPFGIWPDYIGGQARQFARLNGRCVFDARFNPMAPLLPDADSFGSDCDGLAEAIVWQETGEASHWADSARQLVSGLIMHIAATAREDKKNLNQMRAAVCDKEKLFALAQAAVEGEDEFIAAKLARFADKDAADNREIGSIISTAITQTGFIGSRAVANNLSASDFRFRDLRAKPTTVYIILPTRHLSNCGKWFRLLVASALSDLLIEEERGCPILCVLDEFAQLGYLKLIEDAMGLAAGYGVQMLCVLQDLNQLNKNYAENFETFIANAGVSMWFAPRDVTTSEYVSKLCGTKWELMESRSVGENPLAVAHGDRDPLESLHVGTGQQWQQISVMEPDAVRKLGRGQFIMFAENHREGHFIGSRQPYWLMPEFRGKFGQDPYHV